jgi:hypothetical protein
MADFRDVVYLPARALLAGDNPYDVEHYMTNYPAGYAFPLYSPGLLIASVPLAMLPWKLSLAVYWCLNVVLYPLLARVCLSLVLPRPTWSCTFLLATALLITTPGRANFNAGQITLPVVLGSLAAVYYASRYPKLAVLGLTLAVFKPTFGVPIGILLMVRGNCRVALWAAGWSGLLAILAIGVIDSNPENRTFSQVAWDNQSTFGADPMVAPSTSQTRIDALPFSAHFLGIFSADAVFGAVLGVAALVLCLARGGCDPSAPTDPSHAVILAATLVGIHHQVYDTLLLAAPATVLLGGAWRGGKLDWARVHFAVLSCVPAVNILWAPIFLKAIHRISPGVEPAAALAGTAYWTLASTLNSTALFAALLVSIWLVLCRATDDAESKALSLDF